MDECFLEQAARLAEVQVESAMKRIREERAETPTGRCFNCGEKLPAFSGMRWCVDTDSDGKVVGSQCREDWEKRNGRK